MATAPVRGDGWRIADGEVNRPGLVGTPLMTTSQRVAHKRALLALRLTGACLLVVTGAIHLDLYLTGYRSIPTIGWMFGLQVLSAFTPTIVVALRRSWLASAAGAAFAASTLGGYLLSVWIGLFGFKEVRRPRGSSPASSTPPR